ncbi:MFS transporter [Polynucleobacter sp. MWH-UH23A]|uniref:MFS transporter n=1 Tax=Polynucleobacter sp. MWH-UH23A TaxID=1855613 RepID=UPI003364C4E6
MFQFLAAIRDLPKTVWLIGLISLVNDSASEMLYPLLPLYLTSVLMAGPKVLGLIEGIAESTSSLLKLVSGVVVDKTKKTKPWIVVGYFLAGVGRPLIAFINSWEWLLLIRFTDRIGKGLRSSPRDALLAESAAKDQRGLVFGFHRSMDNAGAVFGPLIAAYLLYLQVPLRDIFLWAIIPALVTLGLALSLNEPRKREQIQTPVFQWSLEGLPTEFKRYLLVAGIFTLGNSSDMFLLLRAREIGVPQAQIPLLWAGVSLVITLFGAPLSAISDRYGRKRFILISWASFVVFYFGMGLPSLSVFSLYALFGLYGLFKAASEGVEKALVADLAPIGRAGAAFGWFNLVNGVMVLPASLIFGEIYESISASYAFIFSGTCAVISIGLLKVWVFKSKMNRE